MNVELLRRRWCSGCAKTKSLSEFHRSKKGREGHSEQCKACVSERHRRWYAANKAKKNAAARAYQESHAAEAKAYQAKWRAQPENRERERERLRKAYVENQAANLKASRRSRLNRKFGLTMAEYERMAEAQGHRCALCDKPETRRTRRGTLSSLAVDHCHATGKVRGLLCFNCNTTLGKFGDDPALLRRAAEYLERHGLRVVAAVEGT